MTVIGFLMILLAPGELQPMEPVSPSRPSGDKCFGYTITEFGKGINCNGDTIRLTRKNGLQVYLESKH
jgi:hypothetical protein